MVSKKSKERRWIIGPAESFTRLWSNCNCTNCTSPHSDANTWNLNWVPKAREAEKFSSKRGKINLGSSQLLFSAWCRGAPSNPPHLAPLPSHRMPLTANYSSWELISFGSRQGPEQFRAKYTFGTQEGFHYLQGWGKIPKAFIFKKRLKWGNFIRPY